MRAGIREESINTRGGTAWNDGLYPINGGGNGAVSSNVSTTENTCSGAGGTFGEGEAPVSQKAWFDPVIDEEVSDCPGGICPVPWAVKEEPPVVSTDLVNHPPHYADQGGVECIEAIEAQLSTEEYQGYLRGNCVKYLWRWRHKGGLEDLKKAQWYLNRLVDTAQKG